MKRKNHFLNLFINLNIVSLNQQQLNKKTQSIKVPYRKRKAKAKVKQI